MGGRTKSKKGSGTSNKKWHRNHKTKHYTKDMDLRYEDLRPENTQRLTHQPIDEDLPGLGQYYCVPCSRYFQTEKSQKDHIQTKIHKRSLKDLKEKPYTIEEAEEYGKY